MLKILLRRRGKRAGTSRCERVAEHSAVSRRAHGAPLDPVLTLISRMKAYLDAREAEGGGDVPEAVLEGSGAGLTELAWTPKDVAGAENVLRLIYLVGDAPAQHYGDSPKEAWLAGEALPE